MENELIVRKSVMIEADNSKTWNALTDPKITRKYWFNCEPRSEWEIGKPIEFVEVKDGKEIVRVKGDILSIDPCKFLQYTVWGPDSGLEDRPENYTRVTIELFPDRNRTEVMVSQDMFGGDVNRFKMSNKGWDTVLEGLKNTLES
jgi:uncharacterized protein YndB with AHSA1/START domain